MTLPYEMYNSLRNTKKFLYDLLDSTKTPRVPKSIRLRARDRLKHFPSDIDINDMERRHKETSGFGYPFFNNDEKDDNGRET